MLFKKILPKIKSQVAFTMIELLIVIAILGILAVAVLAAINPVEQINRGRDTGTRSDAEQLLSAIDRYYAYKGYYAWTTNPNDDAALAWRTVDSVAGWTDDGSPDCPVLDKLSNGDDALGCQGTNEVKRSFITKITETDYNHLHVYTVGGSGDSLYVCFSPKSEAFQEEGSDRCTDEAGSGLPTDLQAAAGSICVADEEYVCLP